MTAVVSTIALAARDQGDVGGALPHAVHYGLIVIGLVALSAVALAHLRDPHEAKGALVVGPDPHAPVAPMAQRLVTPAAVVSSAAAAGVHAAMGPPHFEESVLFGLFFVLAAMLQVTWAGLLMVRRSNALLMLGVLGNAVVIALWAVTRTIGLPFGLLPQPEAVGAWDLACGSWELVVIACCVFLLRSTRTGAHAASWREWHGSARVFTGGSVLLLVAMAASGAS